VSNVRAPLDRALLRLQVQRLHTLHLSRRAAVRAIRLSAAHSHICTLCELLQHRTDKPPHDPTHRRCGMGCRAVEIHAICTPARCGLTCAKPSNMPFAFTAHRSRLRGWHDEGRIREKGMVPVAPAYGHRVVAHRREVDRVEVVGQLVRRVGRGAAQAAQRNR